MKEFLKSKKGKIVTLGLVLMVMIGISFGFIEYSKYQESIKSNVVFTDISEIGLSENLMTLIDTYDADTVVVNRIVDANEKVVDETTVGNYTVVFEAVSNGKATEFKKEVTFIDDQAPMILGASDKEIDYAVEINLLDGITAEDNVDGIVEVTSTPLNNKLVGIQTIEYFARDAAGNETKLMINVTVNQPLCAVNATWNGENCVCDSGYTGDGWSGCKVVSKKTNAKSNGGVASNTMSNNNQDNSNNSGSNGGWNNWTIESPSDSQVNQALQDGNNKFGEGNSWGGMVMPDGSISYWD